ncbi:hypothetical protein ES703_95639 [subsurface metagenome]
MRHREFLRGPARGRVKHMDFVPIYYVHAVRNRDVVASNLVSAWLMTGIVVVLAYILKISFPQQSAGIDINRPEHVPPFDEKPTGGYLWRWAVSMTR